LNPTAPEIQYGLGQMYIVTGNITKAIECFEKVLAKDSEDPEALKVAH
jgi:tetratricopeptide (TPR) repeat protein